MFGIPEELAALLCYVPVCGVGPLVGGLLLIVARRRPWLRSQAWQGLLLALLAAVAVVGLWLGDFALETAGLPTPGLATALVQIAVLAAYVAISVRAMVRAYRRLEPTMPWIGAVARRWALRNGRRPTTTAVPIEDPEDSRRTTP